jgi:hypothetical protein
MDYCKDYVPSVAGLLPRYRGLGRRQEPVNAFGQLICSVTDSSSAFIPFQAICTPIQTRKKDDNCVITVIPVGPRIRANRSANP